MTAGEKAKTILQATGITGDQLVAGVKLLVAILEEEHGHGFDQGLKEGKPFHDAVVRLLRVVDAAKYVQKRRIENGRDADAENKLFDELQAWDDYAKGGL